VGDTASLAALIHRALACPKEASSIGQAARRYVVETMDVNKMVKDYAGICESLI